VNDDLGLIESLTEFVLHLVADRMRTHKRHRGIEFDMDLDEGVKPRLARAQLMQADHFGMRFDDGFDLLPFGIGQFMIHQLIQAALEHQPGACHQDGGHEQRDDRIGRHPAQLGHQENGDHDTDIGRQIADIMRLIGGDRDRTGALDHAALIEDKPDRHDDGYQHHDQGRQTMFDGLGAEKPLHGLDHQKQGRSRDKSALRQPRQRLGLAMTKTMFSVGGSKRFMNGEEIERRGEEIERGIGEAGQHRHRMGKEISQRLDCHQEERNAH